VGLITFLSTLVAGCSWLDIGPKAPIPPIITEAPPPAAYENLTMLQDARPPERDLVALAEQLGGAGDVPRLAPPDDAAGLGDVRPFWYKNRDRDENLQIDARLLYQSGELNLWFEESLEIEGADVRRAAAVLETQILPTNRAFFGEEWRPGVDGDLRLNVLHVERIGGDVVGYFSAADEFVTAVNPYSNQREMFYVSLDLAPLGSQEYFQVIAHEMQHMIHWHTDSNEATWVDEGLAVLAAWLNGYRQVGFDEAYAAQTDVQLNRLDYESEYSSAHYGAAFLFTAYFLDRYGEEATQSLVRHPQNGIAGFESTLADLGQPLAFDELFGDWTLATYLDGHAPGQKTDRYELLDVPQIQPARTHQSFPVHQKDTVNQYGTDYVRVLAESPVTAIFTGTRQIPLLQTTPHSGDTFWTTLPADDSDMTLTRRFDLGELSQASLSFWSWYEIEEGWDYAYVIVSTDGGQTWHFLETEQMTREDPQGNSYGPALTGNSGGQETPRWVQQTADLSPYAGGPILLRFRYVTDDALHRQGLALDDVSIPELEFLDDAENGDGDWEARGFVRHSNVLPQRFLVQSVLLGERSVQVEQLPLTEGQTGRWTLPLNGETNEAILIISGTTPVTGLPASYAYDLAENSGTE
jgi:hypothetical protein